MQSRYYDSEGGRFVNGDDVVVIVLKSEYIFKDNLYIYCNSNPVNNYDYYGLIAITVAALGKIAMLVAVGLTIYATYKLINNSQFKRSMSDIIDRFGEGIKSLCNIVIGGRKNGYCKFPKKRDIGLYGFPKSG